VTDEAIRPTAGVPVESNTISFEILPRDETWETAQLDLARHSVDGREEPTAGRSGCRMMRFLETDAAALEMVRPTERRRRSGATDYSGLFSAEPRRRRASDGAAPCPWRNQSPPLCALAILSVYLEHPTSGRPRRENSDVCLWR
jgi:hypothetical protein